MCVLLERFPGKGGWTFARIPEVSLKKKNPFGLRKVNGFIDDYELRDTHLMPMGNNQLFLPVKAEIRKVINKQQGDWVSLVLYADCCSTIDVAGEFFACLEDEPQSLLNFQKLPDEEQEKYIDWIRAAASEEVKVKRIVAAIDKLMLGLSLKG